MSNSDAVVEQGHPRHQHAGEAEEQVVVFGRESPLVGILSTPDPRRAASRPAFVIVNSGLIHRVGPNCQNTRLARDLAARGFPCLRFDHSGVGDSPPARDSRPVSKRWTDEIAAAIDVLEERTGARRAVALGNCSGAAGSFLIARADPRIAGVAMLNPQATSVAVRYFLRLMFSNSHFWARLFQAQMRILPTLRGLMYRVAPRSVPSGEAPPSSQEIFKELVVFSRRGVRVLIIACEWDASYDTYYRAMGPKILARTAEGNVTMRMISGANHDFTLLRNQKELTDIVLEWAEGFDVSTEGE